MIKFIVGAIVRVVRNFITLFGASCPHDNVSRLPISLGDGRHVYRCFSCGGNVPSAFVAPQRKYPTRKAMRVHRNMPLPHHMREADEAYKRLTTERK